MRLIDADKLKPTGCLGLKLQKADSIYLYLYEDDVIEKAPTIEAIPVEWIENWLNGFYRWINGTKYYMGDGYDSTATMLDEWRKENEQGKV